MLSLFFQKKKNKLHSGVMIADITKKPNLASAVKDRITICLKSMCFDIVLDLIFHTLDKYS